MSELLLEVCSGEIPARMQESARRDFGVLLLKNLQQNGGFEGLVLQSWVTPQRLGYAIINLDLAAFNPPSDEFRGPKVGASPHALEGFIHKHKVTIADLEIKNGYYVLTKSNAGIEAHAVIAMSIKQTLQDFVWSKSMLEGVHTLRWVRPMRSILCLLDGEILAFEHHHIKSGNVTIGHRFMGAAEIVIASYSDYLEKMSANKVILSSQEREAMIMSGIEAATMGDDMGPRLIIDPDLMKEICGLVECPHVIIGPIESRFMALPKEVLVLTLKHHQRYLMLQYPDGKLAPYYVIVANLIPEDGGDVVLQGNARVLNARLSDAKFFFDQDIAMGIEALSQKSAGITFHADIGNIGYKQSVATEIAVKICALMSMDSSNVVQALTLAKGDLSSVVVREFPELQGVMGGCYAQAAGYHEDICAAIGEQYKPQGPNDTLPKSLFSAIICISDKLAVLHLLFGAGIKPTGSKDPHALRRAALGIWRIVEAHNMKIDFQVLGLNAEAVNFLYDKQS